jgi:hypothetical protein
MEPARPSLRWGRALGALAVAALLAGCGAPGARLAAATGSSGGRDAAMTAAIRGVMRQWSIPGAIVGVWQQGRAPYVRALHLEPIRSLGRGRDDLEPGEPARRR